MTSCYYFRLFTNEWTILWKMSWDKLQTTICNNDWAFEQNEMMKWKLASCMSLQASDPAGAFSQISEIIWQIHLFTQQER